MNDGNQSGDRSTQDIYNDFDPATAELPAIESQSQPLDLSSVPDAPDGYGLPQQVDAITPESSFAPSNSGIEEFTQYDDTYFDDVEHVTEQTKIGAVSVPDEFDFGADDNSADDQHVRFIDERPQGALNGRVLAIVGAVAFVLVTSIVVGYTLTRGGGDSGGNEIVAADGSKEDEEKLANESDTTVAQIAPSDNGALEPNVVDPGSPVEAPQDPASPITVTSSPQATTKSGVSIPLVTTKPTTASSKVTTKPSSATTVDTPVTTVDTPVTTVDTPVTTVEDPVTTVDVVTVSVPTVVGLTAGEAQDVIEEAGLVFKAKLVRNALDADDEPLPNNYVISSDPEAGEKVEEGSTVVVAVNRVVPVTPPLAAAGQANP